MTSSDVVIIGAGGAGLMCALTAGQRGRSVMVIDHASKIGEKIRISGGGRCNFTNLGTTPDNFLSQNPHFCRSALARFGPQDFIAMVERRGIAYHEKTLGQLFCDTSSKDIIAMLTEACEDACVSFRMETSVKNIEKVDGGFNLQMEGVSDTQHVQAQSLVIATGGLSIPKIGATDFGYRVAKQFGLGIVEPRPGLVPFVFEGAVRDFCTALAGVSLPVTATCNGTTFAEALLFTHRGLSGPAILQVSSYWRGGDTVSVNLSPDTDVLATLKFQKTSAPKQSVENALADILPRRLAQHLCKDMHVSGRLADLPDKALEKLATHIHDWRLTPSGTEGYRTAEVTVGGVDTTTLSSKTMESQDVPGLYFIGEAVDVTGHLGGYNFQWAWASGHAAGSAAGSAA